MKMGKPRLPTDLQNLAVGDDVDGGLFGRTAGDILAGKIKMPGL